MSPPWQAFTDRLNSQQNPLSTSKLSTTSLPLFRILQLLQLTSTLIIASILIFFIDRLRDEHFSIPWTFILLLALTLITITHLLLTTVLTHFIPIPTHLDFRNIPLPLALLTTLWLLTFALFTNKISSTLSATCGSAAWQHDGPGRAVCRLYKALEAFVVLATITTAALLALDVSRHAPSRGGGAHKRAIEFGSFARSGRAYERMDDENTRPDQNKPGLAATMDRAKFGLEGIGRTLRIREREVPRGQYSGMPGATTVPDGFEQQRLDQQGPLGPESWRNTGGAESRSQYRVQRQFTAREFGYEVPSEQTMYGGGGAS